MNASFRILHLRASNFVGGPEKQLLRHAAGERSGTFEITLGTFVGKEVGRQFLGAMEELGVSSLAFPDQVLGRRGALSGIVRVLRERKIGLLCTHGYKADVVGTLAARQVGIPVAWFLRGWTGEDWKVRVYEALDRLLLPFATRIVCLSETQARRLSTRRTLTSKLRVVPNSVDVRDTSPEQRAFARQILCGSFDIPKESSIVATAGRLSPEKGASFFIRSVSEILHEHPSTHFILFGDGSLKNRLRDLSRDLGISSQVHFAGFMPNFRELLPGVDVLVNPSLSEEMPNVVLEAMAAELPMVATNVGAVREIAGSEKCMEIVPSGQPYAIATAIIGLLKEPSRAAQLGQRAKHRVQQAFSAARQNKSLHALYEELLNEGSQKLITEDQDVPRSESMEQTIRADNQGDSALPFVSVIIPVRNEEKHLRLALDGLLNQDYPKDRYEILVVDGNSADRTPRVVEETAKNSIVPIRLLCNPQQLSSAGRNVGVRSSRGELIVFIDGHCHIPSRDLLRDTAQLFSNTGAACLCRPQPLTPPGNSMFQTIVANVRSSLIAHGLDSTIYSTNLEGFVDPMSSGASYRREVFDHVGFYNEELDACEDVEFNYRLFRAGLRSYTSPRLTIQYHPRNSFSALYKQMVRYGKGRCRLARLHPKAFSVAQVMPALFVLWVLLGILLAPISKLIVFVYLTTLCIYTGVVLAFSAWLGIRHGWRHLLAAPGLYATIHSGLGIGFLMETLQSMRRSFSSGRAGIGQLSSSESILSAQSRNERQATTALTMSENVVLQAAESGQRGSAAGPGNETRCMNALTVDVEDYFHTEAMTAAVSREQWEHLPSRVQSNTYRLFELMAAHNVCGTFFFLGWVAQRFPGLVREAVELGHEIACHSYWHRPIYQLSANEFRADTFKAKCTIEDAGGVLVRGYRAPSFSMVPGTEWAAPILAEMGFAYDSSVHPISHDIYDNAAAPRVPHRICDGALLELPIATCRLGRNNLPIGGGGYLRILPYFYTRWGLTRFKHKDGQSAVVYLHPWEIDPMQPRLRASRRSVFRQYTRLSAMETKLTHLLQDFRFAPLSTVFNQELEDHLHSGNSRPQSLPCPQGVR
jgi:succinoglycan biosynthesis protein ExoA